MASTVYRFREFQLDPGSRQLCRGDEELALPRKVFDCIVYLIEHRERAVERDELFAAVWGDVQLSDGVLAQTILEARKALHDTGDEQLFIKTIRGFGYHWVASVDPVGAPTGQATRSGLRPAWIWIFATLLAAAALIGAVHYLRRDGDVADAAKAVSPTGASTLALLLPVDVDADAEHAWIRLGVMDLIAERLRAAGQPMVPSDTVIALLRDVSSDPGPDDLDTLAATTGARWILSAATETTGTRWRVSLRSLYGPQPPLTALAEAEDVLETATTAADRLALALGLTPAPEPTAEPGVAMLLHMSRAATLAQRHDMARALIEDADAKLRQHPEIRFQMARIEIYSHRLDAAQTILVSLLPETRSPPDADFRARVLHALGWVYKLQGDLDEAESVLQEAARLLAGADTPTILARVRLALGTMATDRGDFEAATLHFAHARVALEGTGDEAGLATLDNHLGELALRRERYAEALSYFEKSAGRAAALNNLGNELIDRANILYVHLGLLDPQAAQAVEPRVHELLAQTANPWMTALANLTRAHLLAATGNSQAASSLLAEVLRATDGVEDIDLVRIPALVLRAEMAARAGEAIEAASTATEVIERVPADYVPMAEERGRAGLILVRGNLVLGRRPAAAEAAAALALWAERGNAMAPKIYSALAQAELAAADGRDDEAEAGFEQALALADSSGVPLRQLQVAQSYVPWLLTEGLRRAPNPERALVVADRVAEYADRHYDAALLQLRVAHAVSSLSAWRIALTRARSLAGGRQLPPELLVAPRAHLATARR